MAPVPPGVTSCRIIVAVAVVPLREAVTVALPLAMTVPEVAVKEAVV